MSARGNLRRFAVGIVAAAALPALGGCRIDVATTVTVGDSGAGSILVVVGADAEAVRSVPDLAGSLNVDDLRAAGWEVMVQDPAPGGGVSVSARTGFNTPEEATELLAQVSGPNGPLRDLSLSRDGGLSDAVYRFAGTAGMPQGTAGFADEEALGVLGGAPFAETLASSGLALRDALGVSLTVTLPGAVSESSTASVTNQDDVSTTFAWNVPVDGSDLALSAGTRHRNLAALFASIAANVFLVLLVLLAVAAVAYAGSVAYRRSRSTPGS